MEKSSLAVTTSDDPHDTLAIMRAEGREVIPVMGPAGDIVGLVWRSRLLEVLADDYLDEALEETFPASDPVSVSPGST